MSSSRSGAITFLFTGIEGSTRLAQQYPQHPPPPKRAMVF
jgi:hypothetical protein